MDFYIPSAALYDKCMKPLQAFEIFCKDKTYNIVGGWWPERGRDKTPPKVRLLLQEQASLDLGTVRAFRNRKTYHIVHEEQGSVLSRAHACNLRKQPRYTDKGSAFLLHTSVIAGRIRFLLQISVVPAMGNSGTS